MKKTKEELLVKLLMAKNMTIAFAESCTGGLCAATLINAEGASNVIKESIITYSNEAKIKYLNVKNETINKFGVVSNEVSLEMALGIKKEALTDIGVGVTGYAGDYGDEFTKGQTVCVSIVINDKSYSYKNYYPNKSRNEIRQLTVSLVFTEILKLLGDSYE